MPETMGEDLGGLGGQSPNVWGGGRTIFAFPNICEKRDIDFT